jgi:hypothetical protein
MRNMAFATKAEVSDLGAKTFAFSEQKTMYGGKHIAKGDTVFIFASEKEGGEVSSRPALSPPRKRSQRNAASLGKPRA